tara:strand:+ start:291 stop:425 length:135 start_codon:yes stop_codon:yes gene_type:complete
MSNRPSVISIISDPFSSLSFPLKIPEKILLSLSFLVMVIFPELI